jgi:hypothetical protein
MNTGKTLFAHLIDFLPRKTLAGKQHYPERLRRIRFRDAETGKMLLFLTNNFDLPALTIAPPSTKTGGKWSYFSDGSSSTFGSSSSMGPRKTRSRPRYGPLCQSSARGDRQKAAPPGRVALHIDAGPFGDNIRKSLDPDNIVVEDIQMGYCNRK